MLKKAGILSLIFISRATPIAVALMRPPWFPGNHHIAVCLIAALIFQLLNLLILAGCLLACKDVEGVPCASICFTLFIILEQISLLALLLCIFVF